MTASRAARAETLSAWADQVEPDDLRQVDTESLRRIAELIEQRDHLTGEIAAAVDAARAAQRSWSEIGAMLGVSKQAAQRRYADTTSA